jgi:hypothetical protein
MMIPPFLRTAGRELIFSPGPVSMHRWLGKSVPIFCGCHVEVLVQLLINFYSSLLFICCVPILYLFVLCVHKHSLLCFLKKKQSLLCSKNMRNTFLKIS